jgi:ribosomal protein L37AE/L43A
MMPWAGHLAGRGRKMGADPEGGGGDEVGFEVREKEKDVEEMEKSRIRCEKCHDSCRKNVAFLRGGVGIAIKVEVQKGGSHFESAARKLSLCARPAATLMQKRGKRL